MSGLMAYLLAPLENERPLALSRALLVPRTSCVLTNSALSQPRPSQIQARQSTAFGAPT